MAVRLSLSMTDGFDHLSPLRVMVLPLQFAATQKLVVGQDTDENPMSPVDDHLPAPQMKAVVAPTATQNVFLGHETE